jgi:hypothetical protein
MSGLCRAHEYRHWAALLRAFGVLILFGAVMACAPGAEKQTQARGKMVAAQGEEMLALRAAVVIAREEMREPQDVAGGAIDVMLPVNIVMAAPFMVVAGSGALSVRVFSARAGEPEARGPPAV